MYQSPIPAGPRPLLRDPQPPPTPRLRAGSNNQTMTAPALGVEFDYFDEVWVCSLSGPVVLHLFNGGTEMMVHHL